MVLKAITKKLLKFIIKEFFVFILNISDYLTTIHKYRSHYFHILPQEKENTDVLFLLKWEKYWEAKLFKQLQKKSGAMLGTEVSYFLFFLNHMIILPYQSICQFKSSDYKSSIVMIQYFSTIQKDTQLKFKECSEKAQ